LVFYDPRPFHGLHWWRKRRLRAAVLLAALVISHWLLDFVTHRPDLPLTPWGETTAPGVLFAFWAAWADRHRATVS
jgi:hypothetical protein